MAGTSRMSREAHVRICGGLEVRLLRSTRPANSRHSLPLLCLLSERVIKVLTGTIETSLLREVHSAQQVLEARVGAQRVEPGSYLQPHHPRIAVLVSPFQPR